MCLPSWEVAGNCSVSGGSSGLNRHSGLEPESRSAEYVALFKRARVPGFRLSPERRYKGSDSSSTLNSYGFRSSKVGLSGNRQDYRSP